MDRLIAREETAYQELVREHAPRMLAVAHRYLPRAHDAEDALQDALVNVFRHISAFKRESSLDTWLHRIVTNCALMQLRRQRRKPSRTLDAGILEDGAASPWRRSPSPSAQEVVATEETRAIVRAFIGRLPEAQRSILMLRDVEGLTTGEVADVLGIGTSTVRVTIHRARRRIRDALGPRRLMEACV